MTTTQRAVRTGTVDQPGRGRDAIAVFEMTRKATVEGQMVVVPVGIKIRLRNPENRVYCVDSVAGTLTRESLAAPAFSGHFAPFADGHERYLPWVLRITENGVPVTTVEPGDVVSVDAEWRDTDHYAVGEAGLVTQWTPGAFAWCQALQDAPRAGLPAPAVPAVVPARPAPAAPRFQRQALVSAAPPAPESQRCKHGTETFSGVGCAACDAEAELPATRVMAEIQWV